MSNKPRMLEQDVAKGLGVVMIMALHILTIAGSAYKIAGGLFGFILPFFFFIAGYNYHGSQYSYWQIVRRRFKQIIVPFLIYSIVITVLAGSYFLIVQAVVPVDDLPNTFINPITHEKDIYSVSEIVRTYVRMFLTRPPATSLGITSNGSLYSCIMMFWFVQMLFVGTLVFHAVVDHALKSVYNCVSIVVGLLGITMILAHFGIHLPFYLGEAPAVAAIMLMGAVFGRFNLLGQHAKKSVIVVNGIVAYGIFLVLAWRFQGSGFIMGGTLCDDTLVEWSVLLTFIFAIVGSYAFVHFCRLLVNLKWIGPACVWCGQNSLRLMMLHGIVTLFVSHIFNVPPFQTAIRAVESNLDTIYVFVCVMIVTVALVKFISFVRKQWDFRRAIKNA